jgi:hypothetical protein
MKVDQRGCEANRQCQLGQLCFIQEALGAFDLFVVNLDAEGYYWFRKYKCALFPSKSLRGCRNPKLQGYFRRVIGCEMLVVELLSLCAD